MNRILEENPVPAIWITNDTTAMDPAFLRRFLMPLGFGTPPRSVRRQMAERHLGNVGVSPPLLDTLAADAQLTPAQLGAARRLVRLRTDVDPDEATRDGIAAQRLLLHGAPAPRARTSATAFDAAFLNLDGELAPARILTALAAARSWQPLLLWSAGHRQDGSSPRSWRRPWTGSWWPAGIGPDLTLTSARRSRTLPGCSAIPIRA